MVRLRAVHGVLPVLALVATAWSSAASSPAPVLSDPVDLGGSRVEVSTDPQNPTPLTAGLWADTITGSGQVDANLHRFSYDRTMADSTVLIGVVATSSEAGGDAVELEVSALDGTLCGSDIDTSPNPATSSAFGVSVVSPSSTYGNRNDSCLTADTLNVTVGRGPAEFDSDLPVAIRVVEEAPVLDAESDLPPAQVESSVLVPTVGTPEPVAGGTSFDGAPDLAPGTYADTLREGDERLYRVRLGWGQALAVRVDIPVQDAAAQAQLELAADPSVNLSVFDPLRRGFDGSVQDAVEDGSYDLEGSRLFDGTNPVTYLNRFTTESAAVPGDYWVSLAVAPARDHDPVDVPVELTVEVVGEVGPSPDFLLQVRSPAGGAAPDGYGPQTPYLVDDGVFSAEVSGTPRMPDESAGGDGDVRRTAGLGVGAVSLVCCLGGVLLLRRRVSRPAARH